MKNLETLIQELCPDGVEFVKLGDVCDILDSKRKPVAKGRRIKGEYPYYGANGIQDYIDGYIFDGTYLLLGEDGSVINKDNSPVLNWATGKIWVNNHAHVLAERNDIALLRYLYYVLQTCDVSSIVRGMPPKLNQENLRNIEIPLPPIEVQTEIVRILDKFTSLEAELEAELKAELDCRKRQYEYYRDKLLSFENVEGQEVEWKKLNDIVIFKNGKGHEKSIVDEGKYIIVNSKFVSTNGMVRKYSDVQLCPLYKDSILMVMSDLPNGRALAKCFLVDKDDLYTLNQRVGSFVVNDNKVVVKFLFYILNRNRQLLQYDNGVDQTNLRKSDILNILIPIPSLAEQHRIVSILDRFESLTTSLQSGLPAEIAARRQQYEHYRDKLLTFKRKGAV